MESQGPSRDEEILRVLQEIRDMVREILVNQRMNILRERAVVNEKERALQELTDQLFAYINKHRLLGDVSWWVTSEALVVRDLRSLLGRYQRGDLQLGWGDLLNELRTEPENPLRNRAIEVVEFMLRRETGE